jgi:hypothetical protein
MREPHLPLLTGIGRFTAMTFGSGARQTDRALASFGPKANFAGMAASGVLTSALLVKEHRAFSLAVDLGAAAIILINVATLVLAMTTPATISHSTVPPSQ